MNIDVLITQHALSNGINPAYLGRLLGPGLTGAMDDMAHDPTALRTVAATLRDAAEVFDERASIVARNAVNQ